MSCIMGAWCWLDQGYAFGVSVCRLRSCDQLESMMGMPQSFECGPVISYYCCTRVPKNVEVFSVSLLELSVVSRGRGVGGVRVMPSVCVSVCRLKSCDQLYRAGVAASLSRFASKHRYTGRTFYESHRWAATVTRPQPYFERSASQRMTTSATTSQCC